MPGCSVVAVCLLLASAAPTSAQQGATRSEEIGRTTEKNAEVSQGRYVFAGIGVDDYEH
jgi:hypothetical protein